VLPALVVALGDTVLRLEIDAEAVALRPVAVELSFDSIDALASGCRGSGIACTPWPGSDRSPGAAPAASRRDAGRPRVRRLAVDIGEQCGLTLIASS